MHDNVRITCMKIADNVTGGRLLLGETDRLFLLTVIDLVQARCQILLIEF